MPQPRFRSAIRSLLVENIEVVDCDLAAVLRAKTEGERLRIAWGMWRSARDMLRQLLRAERPDWTVEEINREVARRLSHGAC